MFEQTFVDGTGKTNKTWTVLVSFIGQLHPDWGCGYHSDDLLRCPAEDPVDQFPGGAASAAASASAARGRSAGESGEGHSAPVRRRPADGAEGDPERNRHHQGRRTAAAVRRRRWAWLAACRAAFPAARLGGVLGGIIGSVPTAAPPPPPPPVKEEAKPVAPQRIRVGGNVQQAKLVRQPKPVYPPLAKQARIQGVVRLHGDHRQGRHDSEPDS